MKNSLQWNAHRYPECASLASDYLAIMASFISTERGLSLTGITISNHHMTQTVRMACSQQLCGLTMLIKLGASIKTCAKYTCGIAIVLYQCSEKKV